MYRAGRAIWGLAAIGAATAVGVTTHDAGFVVITFLGTLWLPRILGLTPSRWGRADARGWHRSGWSGGCAGAARDGSDAPASTSAAPSI